MLLEVFISPLVYYENDKFISIHHIITRVSILTPGLWAVSRPLIPSPYPYCVRPSPGEEPLFSQSLVKPAKYARFQTCRYNLGEKVALTVLKNNFYLYTYKNVYNFASRYMLLLKLINICSVFFCTIIRLITTV